MAEQAYDKEHLAIANQPALEPVRLCLDSHARRVVLSAAGAPIAGNESASAATPGVQPVPSGDTSVAGPDIGPLLRALAGRADQVSATLREYQAR
jgi:hypothetical protein